MAKVYDELSKTEINKTLTKILDFSLNTSLDFIAYQDQF